VTVAEFKDPLPDVSRDHGGIPCSPEPDGPSRKEMPILPDVGIAAPVVGIPDGKGSLKPLDVAGSLVVPGVRAVTADTGAPAILETMVGLDIPRENPRLEHGAGLPVSRSLAETGDNANDGGAIEGGGALPQDAAVWIDGHDETERSGLRGGGSPRWTVSGSGQLAVDHGANFKHLMIRGREAPA